MYLLFPLLQGKQLFERRCVDSFRLLLSEVGVLQSITVWTEGGGLGSDWFLDKMELQHLGSGRRGQGQKHQVFVQLFAGISTKPKTEWTGLA